MVFEQRQHAKLIEQIDGVEYGSVQVMIHTSWLFADMRDK